MEKVPLFGDALKIKSAGADCVCCDPSCGLAPSDDAPTVLMKHSERVMILKDSLNERDCSCEHEFHTGCLVSASRVAGYGPQERDLIPAVEVACPVCRTHGYIPTETWREGEGQLKELY